MGVVFKARDTRLGRLVAIKVLPPDKVKDPERKRRFIQEAKAASALNHPNIVTIYDIGSEDGADFIVMEFIDGKPLGDMLARGGLRLHEALNIAIPIADALTKAHSAAIIHRDLKPGNVMVTTEGAVKLLDFGLAKLVETSPETDETQTIGAAPLTEDGAILGTVSYMSPEQAEGKPVDARSDIFAFGSVFYEMLTGQRAFRENSRVATMAAILNAEPKPVAELAPGTPREIERMLARCLRKDPAKRWQSMADLRTSLQEFKEDSDSGLTRSSGPQAAPPPKPNYLWPALALGVVALLGVTWWITSGAPTTSTPQAVLVTPVPLTTYPGSEASPSISPDGVQVAFAWDGEAQDNFDIYVKRVGPGPPLRLTNDPARDGQPAWSPDGTSIAFVRETTNGATIFSIPPLGGPARRIADVSRSTSLVWSPDGKWLAISDQPAGQPNGVWLLSPDSGERRRLTQGNDGPNSFSPDGRSLILSRSFCLNATDLFLVSLDEKLQPVGEPRQITQERRDLGNAVWLPGGQELLYTSGEPGNVQLRRLNVTTGAAQTLTAVGEVRGISYAPKAKRLVLMQNTREFDIYRADMATGGEEVLRSVPLLTSTRFDRQPSYSPDGSKVAFVSLRSGAWQVWASDRDGHDAVQLTNFERGETSNPRWSPDGSQIVFTWNTGEVEAYTVNAGGGTPRKLDFLGKGTAVEWSRDGRSFLFTNTSSPHLQRVPVGGGTPAPLMKDVEAFAQSVDGKTLYAVRRGELLSRALDGGEERKLASVPAGTTRLAASATGLYVLHSSDANRPGELFYYRFPGGPLIKVSGIDDISRYGLSISPDGRSFLYAQMAATGSDLMLVENFQ